MSQEEESMVLENFPKDEDIEEPFQVSKKGLDDLMNGYLSRKFDEDLVLIKRKGGIKWLESALQTNFETGLNDSDDLNIKRKQVFDTNEKEPEKPLNFCDFVLQALEDRVVQILIIAAIVSIVVSMVQGHNRELGKSNFYSDWIEGFAIVVTVNLVIFLGALNNYDKEKEFRELKQKNDKERLVTVIRKGESLSISEEEILVGDKLLIDGGMTICADGILISGNNILMDESAMTGEIDMIEKDIYEECIKQRQALLRDHPELKKTIPENYHHKLKSPLISSGTQVSTGKGFILVTAVGINSQNGKIMSLIKANKENNEGTPLQQKLVYMADFIGWCGFVAAILTAIGMSINLIIRATQGLAGSIGIEIMNILLISIVIIVVAVPEGLPLAVTLTLAFSVKRMIQDQNLVRRMEACETMGGANYICTDKTGTLTKNEMNIVKFYDGNKTIDFSILNSSSSKKKLSELNINTEIYELFKLNSACNTSTDFSATGVETSTFKTDLAFTKILKYFDENVVELRKQYYLYLDNKQIFIPFSSKRKKMSTFIKSDEFPQKYRMLLKGGSEIILPSCINYLEEGMVLPLNEKKRKEIQEVIDDYANNTLRTVIIAYKEISEKDLNDWENKEIVTHGKDVREVYTIEESGFTFIGLVGIRDILKDGVPEAVLDCQSGNINLIMVTGDNLATASAIAKLSNIMNSKINRTEALLGEAFVAMIGGLVCENCFKVEDYMKALNEAKKNHPDPEYYNVAISNCKYKCDCFRTEDEAKLKIRQKIIADDFHGWKKAQENETEKNKMEEEVQKKINYFIEKNPINIKKEVVANKENFLKIIKNLCVIARSQPYHKYCLVVGLKEFDNVVAVTGDGTNDAPALSKADVGFAMNNGTDIAKEASDIIIIDNNFTSIVSSVLWGRNVFDNIRRFLQFQLSVNIVACTLVFVGSVLGAQSPLSAIQMLWVNMIMDTLGSLALATESPHRGLLNREPSKRNDFMVNRTMTKHIIGMSLFQLVILFIILFSGPDFIKETDSRFINYGFAFNYCFNGKVKVEPQINSSILNPEIFIKNNNPNVYLISGFVSYFSNSTNVTSFPNTTYCNGVFNGKQNLKDAYTYFINELYASTHYTLIFNIFVFMQLFNEICCRIIDDNLNIFFRIQTNFSFFLIFSIEVIGQIIIIEWSKMVFKISDGGLGGFHWGISVAFGAISFIIDFFIKFIPDKFFNPRGNNEKTMEQSKILSFKKGSSQLNNPKLTSLKKGESNKLEGSKKLNASKNHDNNNIVQPPIKNQHIPLNTVVNDQV